MPTRGLSKDTQVELAIQAQCLHENPQPLLTDMSGWWKHRQQEVSAHGQQAAQKQTGPSHRQLESWQGSQATDVLCIHPVFQASWRASSTTVIKCYVRRLTLTSPATASYGSTPLIFRKGQQTYLILHVALGLFCRRLASPVLKEGQVQYVAIHLMKLVLKLVKPRALSSFWKDAQRAAHFLSWLVITRESQHPFLFANFIECKLRSLHFLYLEEC